MMKPRFDVPHVRDLTKHRTWLTVYSTRWILGDGNCMFRAFAKAIGRIRHQSARQAMVDHLVGHHDHFANYFDGDFDEYITEMAKPGTWGDHLALQALSDTYRVAIKVLVKRENTDYHWLATDTHGKSRMILLFYNGSHYENLVRPEHIPSLNM